MCFAMRGRAAWLVRLAVAAGTLVDCSGSSSAPPSDGGSDGGPSEGTVASEAGAPTDAATSDASSIDATVGEGDGAMAGDARVPLAPRCMRAADAGWPTPFDAGSAPDVASLQQIVSGGGPVIHQPTFVSVTFPGDPYAPALNDFVSSIGCTPYWSNLSDYGVGLAVGGTPVELTESAPAMIDDTMIGTWLAGKIDNGDPLFPRPAPDTVYVLWYPATTTATQGGLVTCVSAGGFHGLTTLRDGTPIPYAVIPRCTSDAGDANNVAYLVSSASHELVETCTDPEPAPDVAYGLTDPNHLGASIAGLSEIADVCEGAQDAFVVPPGYPWPLQRFWSNHAAWTGQNPCLPSATTEYFYAAPIVTNTKAITVGSTGHTFTDQAAVVQIAVGSSVSIDVQVVSTVTGGGTIQVVAFDGTNFVNGGTPHLVLTWQTSGGSVNGDTGVTAQGGQALKLGIQKSSADPSGVETFILFSSMVDGNGNTKRTFTWGLTAE
jgi:hypothetical protein